MQDLALKAQKDFYESQSQVSIISNGGIYAASSSNPEQIGKNISEFSEDAENQLKIIKKGKNKILENNGNLEVYIPINIGKTISPWQVRVSVPLSSITRTANIQMIIQLIMRIKS